MKVTYAPRGILQVDDAKIIFRNFAGAQSKYNREGDRNFAWVIEDEETAKILDEEGWNIKVKPPRDEDDTPLMFLTVKIKFNERGPAVYLKTGGNMVKLDEDDIGLIDNVDILSVSMDIRPFDWEVNGKTGRSAYLQSICVTQDVDRFAVDYKG